MPDPGAIRAFLAVPPDPGWAASARRLVAALAPGLPEASWTQPGSWHITLRFLGSSSPAALEELSRGLADAASRSEGGDLRSAGALVFPTRGPARVLAIGFAPGRELDALASLACEIEPLARALGFPPEERPFRAHVTLARVRRSWPPGAVQAYRRDVSGWSFPPWPVSRCVLFASRLGPGGAVHVPVAEWNLASRTEAVRR